MLSQNCISENSQTQMTFSARESFLRPRFLQTNPFPKLTMLWIKEVEKARSIDDLVTSRSIEDYEILNGKKHLSHLGAHTDRRCASTADLWKLVSRE